MSYDAPKTTGPDDKGSLRVASDMEVSAEVSRRCVRCGFCTATCPTYVETGDELEGPRGRIALIRNMLQDPAPPAPGVVKHIDNCLSCLGCETTCPSGVSYRRLIDHARSHVEKTYQRPASERFWRNLLANVLPYRGRFAFALGLAQLARPLAPLLKAVPALRPAARLLALAKPQPRVPSQTVPQSKSAQTKVVLFDGCVEPVLGAAGQAASLRLLARLGCEIVPLPGESCCGALAHHMGREDQALHQARQTIDRLMAALEAGATHVVVTASGCGAVMRDYGHLLRADETYARKAATVAAHVRDITEVVARLELPSGLRAPRDLHVVYHSACSLQHAQGVRDLPLQLLRQVGFRVSQPAEAHLCCGSAGVYNILQPDMAEKLGRRKASALAAKSPDVIAAGNLGCMTQIAQYSGTPIVHTAELLDWALGGPVPPALR